MKRLEDFTKEDLIELRSEIVLYSIYISDYSNSFGITPSSTSTFFDGYCEYLEEIEGEDTIGNLWDWFNCYNGFSWVEYDRDSSEDINVKVC